MDEDGVNDETVVNICNGASICVFVMIMTFMRRMESRRRRITNFTSKEREEQKEARRYHMRRIK